MLMSLRTNAGLVSLLYPFVVFGYALLEGVCDEFESDSYDFK